MPVRVMHVRYMGVAVLQPVVAVRVSMGLAGRITGAMLVLMMLVVNVRMGMVGDPVLMLVLVRLGEMQPDSAAHEKASHDQLRGYGLVQQEQRRDRTQEWSGGEIGSGSRGAEMTEAHHEQR